MKFLTSTIKDSHMHKTIGILLLIVLSGLLVNAASFASESMRTEAPHAKPVIEKITTDRRDKEFFATLIKTNPIYPMLLALEDELPVFSKTLEFVALFNEVHEMNQRLALLGEELKKNNALLANVQNTSV